MAGAAVPQSVADEAVAETATVAEKQGSAERAGLALPPVRVERSGSVPSGSDRAVLVEPEQQTEPSAAATPTLPNDALEREVRLLDEVRARCSATQYSQALALLDLHRQKFDGGALGPEALVLRVQALLGEGRRAEAQSVAKPYLASNRESSISKRLIALLGNGVSAR
jgi:hypothetical protein